MALIHAVLLTPVAAQEKPVARTAVSTTDLNPLAGSFTPRTFAVGILTAAVAVPLIMARDGPAGS